MIIGIYNAIKMYLKFSSLQAVGIIVSRRIEKSLIKNNLRRMSQTTVKGVELKKITSYLENFAPRSMAEPWDNTGLLLEPTSPQLIQSVLLTNDLTEDVMSEALDLNVGLIISYHPPIFKPLTKITSDSWKGRIIASCLENRIAVYSPHTSWDSIAGGINDWLASAFDIKFVEPINQMNASLNSGSGRYCKLKKGIKISEAVEKVKKLICINHINLALAKSASLDTVINDVAICAGSGANLLANVKSELYLTGEMSHHSLLDAIHNGTSVILCNHSNSERGFLKEFVVKLGAEFGSDVQVVVSKKDKDPLQVL